ncbi:hypothetical protein MUP32_00805 [Candidatus Microgenomates bacterium]|nr:hypothetical protein [Candidatus Microgenomates bacterium]
MAQETGSVGVVDQAGLAELAKVPPIIESERKIDFQARIDQAQAILDERKFKPTGKLRGDSFASFVCRKQDGQLDTSAVFSALEKIDKDYRYIGFSNEEKVKDIREFVKSFEDTQGYFGQAGTMGQLADALKTEMDKELGLKSEGKEQGQLTYLRKKFDEGHKGLIRGMTEIIQGDEIDQFLAGFFKKHTDFQKDEQLISDSLKKAIAGYQDQFCEVSPSKIEIKSCPFTEDMPGERTILMSLNIASMARMGLMENSQAVGLLTELSQRNVGNPTIFLHIPIGKGESLADALKKLPSLLEDCVVVRSGWLSTPGYWFEEKLHKEKAPYTLIDEYDRACFEEDGKRRAFIGLAGAGCNDEKGRGTPRIGELKPENDFAVPHQLDIEIAILNGLGAKPHLNIGHSRGGLEALYTPDRFVDMAGHGWAPAALCSLLPYIVDPWVSVRFRMGYLAGLTGSTLKPLTQYVADLRLFLESTSTIKTIVGSPKGVQEERIVEGHNQMLVASDPQANQNAMLAMREGQWLPATLESARQQQTQAQRSGGFMRLWGVGMEGSMLASMDAGLDDYFSCTDESFARQKELYKYLLLGKPYLAEDFGLEVRNGGLYKGDGTRSPISFHTKELFKLSKVVELLYKKQNLCKRFGITDDGGHYHFLDERKRRVLARAVFSEAKKKRYSREDILLAAAGLELPVLLVPELDEKKCTPLDLSELERLDDKRPRVFRISVERYEKIRLLYKLMSEDSQTGVRQMNMHERYWQKRAEMIKRMDFTDYRTHLRQLALEKKMQRSFAQQPTIDGEATATRENIQELEEYIWDKDFINMIELPDDDAGKKRIEGLAEYANFCQRYRNPPKVLGVKQRLRPEEIGDGLKEGLRAVISYYQQQQGGESEELGQLWTRVDSYVDELIATTRPDEMDKLVAGSDGRIGDGVFKRFFYEIVYDRSHPGWFDVQYRQVEGEMKEVMKFLDPNLDFDDRAFYEKGKRHTPEETYLKICQDLDVLMGPGTLFADLTEEERRIFRELVLARVKYEFAEDDEWNQAKEKVLQGKGL